MQSEEPTIIQSLEEHLKECGHTTVGQDIDAAILVIRDLNQKAALSAAEPVAWQPRYKQEVIDHHKSIGSDLWEYAMTVYPTKEQAQGYGYGGHECRALYAAPPAPSVAVKLDSIAHRVHALARMVGTSFFEDVEKDLRDLSAALSARVQDESEIVDCLSAGKPFVFDPATHFCHADDGGAPENGIKYVPAAQVQDADEQRTETCQRCQGNGEIVTDWERYRHPHDNDAGDEAVAECPDCDGIGKVSAQVQDVAGWQPIDIAPKDGTHFIAYEIGDVYRCFWKAGALDDDIDGAGWHDDAASSYENPTHWMPLPAAPAKQEGGTNE